MPDPVCGRDWLASRIRACIGGRHAPFMRVVSVAKPRVAVTVTQPAREKKAGGHKKRKRDARLSTVPSHSHEASRRRRNPAVVTGRRDLFFSIALSSRRLAKGQTYKLLTASNGNGDRTHRVPARVGQVDVTFALRRMARESRSGWCAYCSAAPARRLRCSSTQVALSAPDAQGSQRWRLATA